MCRFLAYKGSPIILGGLIILLFSPALPQESQIDLSLACQYFQEAKTFSGQDNARLWGVELYGPLLLVAPQNREIAANQADEMGFLKPAGDIFTGRLPAEENIANMAYDWAGKRWTMIIWPLPEDRWERASLLAHELFHRIQEHIGLPANNPANAHLDKMDARILLQLEWQALQTALNSANHPSKEDIKNALVFRNYRRELYPAAKKEENALELNEGLAEYTGVKMSGRDRESNLWYLSKKIENTQNLPTLVRSFAYISGPLYGILLDETRSTWRSQLTVSSDLGKILGESYSIEIPQHLKNEVEARSAKYNGEAIREYEQKREENRQARIRELRQKFMNGPLVTIPLQKANFSFDPNNVQPLDSLGTVYPVLRLTDAWGILTVEKDALINSSWSEMIISALHLTPEIAEKKFVEGDGWKLELAEGWRLVLSDEKGNYHLRQIP